MNTSLAMTPDSIGLGRVPYVVDFKFHGYEQQDGEHRRPEWITPNCWSSHSAAWFPEHLPCFDVDVARDVAEPVVLAVFPGIDPDRIEWVESPTPGHHHVYISVAFGWPDYLERLRLLADQGGVEPGYVNAAEYRSATFVRLPSVMKVPAPAAEPTYGDEEPW